MTDPRAWLSEAADEYMRTGSLAVPCPEGVRAVQAKLTGEDKTGRAVRLTASLEDGTVLTEDRWHATRIGTGRGILAGMTDVQHRTRYLRRSRALFGIAALLEMADFAWHLIDGPFAVAPLLGFAAVLFAVLFAVQTATIRRIRAEAPVTQVERPRTHAEAVAVAIEMRRRQQWDVITKQAYRVQGGPRPSAWDVSMILDHGPWNEVCHYQDATGKSDGIADGVIRVIPRTAERPFWQVTGGPLVTSWTVATRAPSHGEGIDLLKAAEPLLRDELWSRYRPEARYFRFTGGRLAEVLACAVTEAPRAEAGEKLAVRPAAASGPCAHRDAEPVDLLVTGERVAWTCPDCPAELPADWR
jgi:hypothetical protein